MSICEYFFFNPIKKLHLELKFYLCFTILAFTGTGSVYKLC